MSRFLTLIILLGMLNAAVLPAEAQTQSQPVASPRPGASAQPVASPQPGMTPQAATPQPATSAQPLPSTPQQQPQQQIQQSPGISAPQVQPGGLPPPPQPAVLPRVPNVAPGYAAPRIEVPTGEIIGVTQQPFVGITLNDAIGMALSKNTDLAIAQANRRIAGYQIEAARGAYDVRFNIAPSYTYSSQPPQNAFFAGPNFGPIVQKQINVQTGVSGITQDGQQYSLTATGGRVNNNSTINTFDPTYPTSLSFNLTQPLARGRSINDASRQLQLAQINSNLSSAQTLATASQTVSNVANAYWDLVAAWRNVAIQEEALRQARLQSQSNARLARQGVSAPIDVVQSNTQVNVFQDNVFSALQNVERLQNQLKSLTLSDPSDPIWTANLVPTSPVLRLPPEPSLTNVVTQALANRPEFDQLRAQRSSANVNLAYAKDQLKPQVNLQLGYTSNGFAGQLTPPSNSPFTQSSAAQAAAINALIMNANLGLPPSKQIPLLQNTNSPVPSYLVGNLGQSISNLLSNRFPTYNVGVDYQIPLGNHTAKANYAIAQTQVQETNVNEIALIERVTTEARNALQAYRAARYRLIAARAAREASEQVLASEQRRFRAGASTTYFVLQRQVDLANNRGRELQAQTDLNKAVVELQRVTGAILTQNNVDATTVGQGAIKP